MSHNRSQITIDAIWCLVYQILYTRQTAGATMTQVVLLGTLDTKGEEYKFLVDELKRRGITPRVVDAGSQGRPSFKPDVTREEVAKAAGFKLASANDRGIAVEAMSRGAAQVITALYEQGRLDGIIGLGGTGGTTLISAAMRELPVGVPKLIVSTVASGDTRPYVGALDITMMYSVVDIAGINKLSRVILGNAAGAIAGMVKDRPAAPVTEKPLIGATMFGVTTPCVQAARQRLESLGYEVLVFHATGTGGQSMEALVRAGMLAGVLDITTTELADELVGGVFSAGPDRLKAAGATGTPQVVSLGALDMVNFGGWDTVPEKFRSRRLYKHNASVTLMRTTPEECAELGKRVAERLNKATGPLSVFVPLRGISMIAREGQPFHDPEADKALIGALRENLNPRIELREVDTEINDPDFANAMADRLAELVQGSNQDGRKKGSNR
ncbi:MULTISPECIES: Tm-1-like ATP-binding domain-containing protein [unclassified Mesorhizobium]|uniref:Tm-1-like ATP-binding domain-containing protein n=1 Tax=unclassified Mesorhizobium TaxID=325217 RepID=UPI001FCCE691|nr:MULTISPECIES: Tm-1-like ATP-binding domain-containing protein [unclassified Mesorhizobium]